MLLIARSYDTKRRRLGSTKTRTAREVPVHPTLAAMLIEWRDTGWRRMFGRDPNSADLIVPYPLTKGKGRRIGGPTTYWSSDTFRKRCYEDCERFRWRRRSPHDGRATFISLTQEDGCSPILERVTHAPQHTVRAGYTRPSWAALCREMAKYRISGTRVQNTDTDTPLTVSQVPAITDGKVGAGGNRRIDLAAEPADSLNSSSRLHLTLGARRMLRKSLEAALASVQGGSPRLAENIIRGLIAEVDVMDADDKVETNVVELKKSRDGTAKSEK